MNRREFLRLASASALSGASILSGCASFSDHIGASSPSAGADDDAARFSLRITPVKLELAPKHIVQTIGYNGSAPGPLLRVKEGQRVIVDVKNDSDVPELVHWHGLYVPAEVDGSMEEGTHRWFPPEDRASMRSRHSRLERVGITHTRLPEKTCTAVSIPDNLVSFISSRRTIRVTTIKKFFSRHISGSRNSSACRTSEKGRRPTTAWK